MENEVRLIDMNTMWRCETCFHHGVFGCDTFCDAGESYRPAADKLKVIDPESLRPKGRWDSDHRCTACGGKAVLAYGDCGSMFSPEPYDYFKHTDYCPNCGAKMEG